VEFLIMTSRRDFIKWSSVAAATALTGLPSHDVYAKPFPLAIVVNPKSPLEQLTLFELKKLYLGTRINDPSGEPIVPLNQGAKLPDRVAFEAKVLGMSAAQVTSYWIDRKIRGQSGPPQVVGNADLIQRVVAKLEHAIAYASLDQLRPEVRFIAIDGKVPTDAAYSLVVGRGGMLELGIC
jgi:hypothetical protein